MTEPPYILGGILILAGYIWGSIKRYKMPISAEYINYLRWEQMNKIKTGIGINKIKQLINQK